MRRRTALALLLFSALPLLAHDEFRIIGVVIKKPDTALQVRNKAGKVFSVALNKDTVVRRDKNKIAAAELKAGLTVVIDALGDSEADLVAMEVRIVPAIAPSSGK
ncbi:MAG: hypothetical protein EXQ47_04255 [Bryobacterales bacterium]|nr:hypothetical protein [Bryobacterales bacterium]